MNEDWEEFSSVGRKLGGSGNTWEGLEGHWEQFGGLGDLEAKFTYFRSFGPTEATNSRILEGFSGSTGYRRMGPNITGRYLGSFHIGPD
jgi:hypothetical protein